MSPTSSTSPAPTGGRPTTAWLLDLESLMRQTRDLCNQAQAGLAEIGRRLANASARMTEFKQQELPFAASTPAAGSEETAAPKKRTTKRGAKPRKKAKKR